MEQKKRGFCPYDDKRYLLANIPDNKPNPFTHAYGHFEVPDTERLTLDHPHPRLQVQAIQQVVIPSPQQQQLQPTQQN
jgi:hypothetical protein